MFPFTDEIGEGESLVLVLLRDRHDETQVRLDHGLQGLLVSVPDAPGQFLFVLRLKQFRIADFLQVDVQRLVISNLDLLGKLHSALPPCQYAACPGGSRDMTIWQLMSCWQIAFGLFNVIHFYQFSFLML